MRNLNRLFLSGAAALALGACGASDENGEAAAPHNRSIDEQADAQAEKAQLGDWGIATDNMDESVDPGDDFYRHVNGSWLDTFQIPDEFSSYGSFTELFERSEERVRGIIEYASKSQARPGSIEGKIGGFYNAYLDVETINKKGIDPLAEDFGEIDGLNSIDDVARALFRPDIGANSPIGAYVDIDAKQPDRYIVYLTQAGLGMPNRDYYLDEKFADKQEKYKEYIESTLSLAGVEASAEKAAAIYDLEHSLAEVHWAPAKRRERDLTYNLRSLDELKTLAPEAPWDAMLDAAGLGDQSEFVVREYDAIQNSAKILAQTPVETWRAYLKFHLVNAKADVLPTAIDDANFLFFGTEIRGTPKKRERWKRGVAAVNDAMGEAVGKVYVERYFPPESKEQMDELVANLRGALNERLDTLSWMSDETKREAHIKLDKFTPKIAYPDKWKDYAGLQVVDGDAYGNSKRADLFAWEDSIARLGGLVDKTEWFMTPQTVNAYYSPNRNEIVFPAAILQAPFFDPNADLAVNYGGIGAVIGHEMGHGFDDQGRKSDGDGLLRDWWTSEDAANFEKISGKLGDQYATYEPIPGFPINPKLTMGENIGDIGGLAMAYHAYKRALDGAEAPIINGYTGDQRFFMAWAQVWKRITRDEALKNQVATDPHSPARYRVNGVVRNMDAWYAAFGVTPDDDLYLPPEQRVQIW